MIQILNILRDLLIFSANLPQNRRLTRPPPPIPYTHPSSRQVSHASFDTGICKKVHLIITVATIAALLVGWYYAMGFGITALRITNNLTASRISVDWHNDQDWDEDEYEPRRRRRNYLMY
ncbi:uncharacterized protein LOC110849989 [Folsomia candida]|uniref:uncharacterized protein LOC110849989 n=1 Tax=Folsomia candida TaxID=158441 RepID=UPI0016053E68|nr:uncharacterized protein LOC110849989 [Folsomia candida]